MTNPSSILETTLLNEKGEKVTVRAGDLVKLAGISDTADEEEKFLAEDEEEFLEEWLGGEA